MASLPQQSLEFGSFRLDPAERQLLRDGQPLPLTAKAYDVLELLVRNPGRTVTKEEFMSAVWSGTAVEEGNLTDNVSTLRQILGDDAREPRFIRTVPRRGYVFVAPVSTAAPLAPSPATPARGRSSARWAVATLAVVVAIALAWFITRERPRAKVTAASTRPRSLAVLPFKPLIASQRDEPLELGMTDALIARMSAVGGLTVRPTSSVLPFAGTAVDLNEAGAELAVDVLLEGKIQKNANRIRVSVQLVRVADGSTIWAERFDEYMTDIFAVQDVIAQRVANALTLQLSEPERASVTRRSTTNVDAYQHYLRGRYFWNKRTGDDFKRALDEFQKAIAKDPQYAAAHAAIAQTYVLLPNWTTTPREDILPLAEQSARRALQLDPNLAEAYVALGAIENHQRNPQAAGAAYRRALQLNPNDSTAHQWYGEWLAQDGRIQDAVQQLRTAHRLDPLSVIISFSLGVNLYCAGLLGEAEEQQRKTLEMSPTMFRPHVFLSRIAFDRGRLEDAARHRAFLLSGVDDAPTGHEVERARVEKALLDAAKGGKDAYLRRQLELVRETIPRNRRPALELEICALVNDLDCAFAALAEVERLRHPIGDNLNVDPYFKGMRSDPRFAQTLQRMGLRPLRM